MRTCARPAGIDGMPDRPCLCREPAGSGGSAIGGPVAGFCGESVRVSAVRSRWPGERRPVSGAAVAGVVNGVRSPAPRSPGSANASGHRYPFRYPADRPVPAVPSYQ
ncbi:MAG: hypothetical protein A9Z00_08190 [Thermobacillus sp. ZCTH02-B1]|nr:MAG: hypothetical protein A9Z00_08190 [Thermobacillus sp. ZCTH02-B1]